MAKRFHPKIASANDLMTGLVMFLGTDGWVWRHQDAEIAHDPEAAGALLARAEAQPLKAVGPYLIDVALDARGIPQPVHQRERMRSFGPSIRQDLTKPASAA